MTDVQSLGGDKMAAAKKLGSTDRPAIAGAGVAKGRQQAADRRTDKGGLAYVDVLMDQIDAGLDEIEHLQGRTGQRAA